jgi:hypothetical protein
VQCARLVERLLRDGFARAALNVFVGGSPGVGRGGGLFVERRGPFDGFVLLAGGAGRKLRVEGKLAAINGDNLIPLTNQPTGYTLPFDDATVADLADQIGFGDPEYRAFALAGADLAEQQARILDYDIYDRPRWVRRNWADTMFDPDIQRPVIVASGTHDQDTWAADTVSFIQKVIDRCVSAPIRFYLVPGGDHSMFGDEAVPLHAALMMIRWIEHGTEPEELVMTDWRRARPVLSVLVEADLFWRQSLDDGLYRASRGLQVPGAGHRARCVGTQLSLTASFTLDERLSLTAAYAHFAAGPFLRAAGLGRDVDFIAVWLSARLERPP